MNETARKQVIWATEHAIKMAKAGKCLWCQGYHRSAKCLHKAFQRPAKLLRIRRPMAGESLRNHSSKMLMASGGAAGNSRRSDCGDEDGI